MRRYFTAVIALLSLVQLLFCYPAIGQSDRMLAQGALAEKVYLQVDADVYTTDQTIWFKAIVLESASHRPSSLSGVLYVDLISPDEQLVEQRRIKLNYGIGQGSIALSDKMARGRYLLRAYTTWNRNFGKDFIFRKYISLFPVSKVISDSPIRGVLIKETQPGVYGLEAKLFPRAIDKAHKKQLTVYLTSRDRKDSVLLKENNQGYYALDYPLPKDMLQATIRMKTENNMHYSRTVTVPGVPLDLQFFPEGGTWLTGIRSKLAFKVLNNLGQGIAVSGKIVDDQGQVLTTFRSNHLGMGSVELTAEDGHAYSAVLDSLSGVSVADSYPLPRPLSQGYALQVRMQEGNISTLAYERTSTTDSLFLQVSSRGILHYSIKVLPHNAQLETVIPAASFPEGILRFTLLDKAYRTVAERLYFNRRPETRLKVQVSTDKAHYVKREKTNVGILVCAGDGQPTVANVSLMAVHRDHLGDDHTLRENILTSLLLQAELRGEISQPNYYFQHDPDDRAEELDALLLSQGWRRYKYDSMPDLQLPYTNELVMTLSGKVTDLLFKGLKKADAAISLLTFEGNGDMQLEHTDSLGNFRFPLELYTDSVEVLLQSANKKGKNRDYGIHLDRRDPLEISMDSEQLAERLDSTVAYLVQQRVQRAGQMAQKGIVLEEIVIEQKSRSRQEQTVFERFGAADTVLSGKAIQAKELKWHWGLYSVLQSAFPDVISFKQAKDPEGAGLYFLKASVRGGNSETLVVVDGIPVRDYCYDLIQYIPPAEVKSMEIIKFADNFSELYREVYPRSAMAPTDGTVIAIYTYAGKGLFGVHSPKGLLKAKVPVYSPIVEFYTPRYETQEEKNAIRPDLRTLLHWSPQLVTDREGKTSLMYYNADIPGEIAVIVEAVTPAGEIGYQELRYIVDSQ